VSSQDFSPVPYPYLAGNGSGQASVAAVVRSRERYWLHGLLLGLTLLTTTVVGAWMMSDFERNLPFDAGRFDFIFGIKGFLASYAWFIGHPASLLSGLPFSLTLMTILLAHEMGHYLASVYHRVDASLPYFLPSPLMGTFGAFIRVRSAIYSKRALFDIGVAGPLAGFVFLVPALAVGLAYSKVIPGIARQGEIQFGAPALQWLLERLIFPGVRSTDIYLHPVARAAWVGMLATALNLLPIGQLDGGHILYAFFPRRHRAVSRALCILLLPLGFFWLGWLFWGVILLWLGRRHPTICDDTRLTPGRRKLGWIALAVFILCFIYAPVANGGL
jgi:membrane-associated protease RseP (regulator of RpoE activity)